MSVTVDEAHRSSGSGVTAAGWFVTCECGWRTSFASTSAEAWSSMAEHAGAPVERGVDRRWNDGRG
jgi:hypothetical protein